MRPRPWLTSIYFYIVRSHGPAQVGPKACRPLKRRNTGSKIWPSLFPEKTFFPRAKHPPENGQIPRSNIGKWSFPDLRRALGVSGKRSALTFHEVSPARPPRASRARKRRKRGPGPGPRALLGSIGPFLGPFVRCLRDVSVWVCCQLLWNA